MGSWQKQFQEWQALVAQCFSPQLCVGFLFVILYPGCSPPPPPPPAASASHIHLSHTTLSPNHLSHTTLSPTIFVTHNFVTHHLSHTIFVTHHLSDTYNNQLVTHHLSHTIFVNHHLHLCQTTTIFVKHHLSHTYFVTHHLSHTIKSPTYIFHTPLCQPSHHQSLSHTTLSTHHLSHTSLPNICVTIFHTPSLSHTIFHTHIICRHLCLRFTWQAWHFGHIHLRFAWQAWHLWHWVAVARLGALDWSRVTPRHFAWQAWHLATSTFVLRGRRGTYGTGWHAWTGLGRGVTPRHFEWQAWHLGAHGHRCCRPKFCVAGVALGHMAPSLLRGRRGTLALAGVALGDIHLRFAWQAWHLVTSTFVLRGKRGTCGTGLAPRAWAGLGADGRSVTPRQLCVAGVALGDIHLRFAWQAWHLWHWVARLDWLGRGDAAARWQAWRRKHTFVLRGRRGTWSHPPSFCVAGVALGQHLVTSTFVLRGRRGTYGTGWRAWTGLVGDAACTLRGRRGTWPHPPSGK